MLTKIISVICFLVVLSAVSVAQQQSPFADPAVEITVDYTNSHSGSFYTGDNINVIAYVTNQTTAPGVQGVIPANGAMAAISWNPKYFALVRPLSIAGFQEVASDDNYVYLTNTTPIAKQQVMQMNFQVNVLEITPSSGSVLNITVENEASLSANTQLGNDAGTVAPKTITNPLPITLTSYTVANTDCNASLIKWTVKDAKDFDHFVIQRSASNGSFTNIATIKFDAAVSNYNYKDIGLDHGAYQYRLLMVDIDGTTKASAIKSVRVSCDETTIVVLPNPVKSFVFVKGITGAADVRITNAQGQVLLQQNNVKAMDKIDVGKFAAATYMIQLVQNGKIISSTQFVKEP